jgi:tRNA pseudouridine38-40 synthase
MRTLCLTLAYDGTAYCGWQWQANGLSIQQVVEEALHALIGEKVRITAAGRTDAGVHAVGQLVSFHTASTIPVEGVRGGLVTKLPADIVVRDVVEMPFGFNARFDAVRKRYRYVIHTSRAAWPWLRNHVWWHRGALDEAAMQAATDVLLGKHDFRCFESQWPNKDSSVRTVYAARWWRCGDWAPWQSPDSPPTEHSAPSDRAQQPFLCFDIVADGFLYNMVRAIVGTMVHVGRGKWTAEDVRRILATGNRSHAGDTAPPQGLYLMDVETQLDPARLAARLERWRRHRPPTPSAETA